MPDVRLPAKLLVGLLAVSSAALAPSEAGAFSPYLVVPDPAVAEASPAYRYANTTDAEAFAELDRRSILYTRLDPVPGVRAPVRLTGRLHGVYVHSVLPPAQRVTSPYEILDARLLLALDDFCALLARHDVDEVVHYTMYRPNVAPAGHDLPDATSPPPPAKTGAAGAPRPRPGTPGGKKGSEPRPPSHRTPAAPIPGTAQGPARKAGKANPPPQGKAATTGAGAIVRPVRVARRDPAAAGLHRATWAPPGTRHPAGLAVDVALIHRRDGRWLSVQRDFHGHVGQRTCGEGAPVPESPDARELRALVCESQELGLFTYVLTPDYDAAHADHFHMEIKPGVRWFLYH